MLILGYPWFVVSYQSYILNVNEVEFLRRLYVYFTYFYVGLEREQITKDVILAVLILLQMLSAQIPTVANVFGHPELMAKLSIETYLPLSIEGNVKYFEKW